MLDKDYELIELLKKEDVVPVSYYTMKRYLAIVDHCFDGNFKNKTALIRNYIYNDRTIIDKYMKNDFKLLKDRIINTRKLCLNRKEIERDVNTLDYQIRFISSCENHRDFLLKNLELFYSNDYKKRREYNIDLYYDITDYFCEKIILEQEENIYLQGV